MSDAFIAVTFSLAATAPGAADVTGDLVVELERQADVLSTAAVLVGPVQDAGALRSAAASETHHFRARAGLTKRQ